MPRFSRSQFVVLFGVTIIALNLRGPFTSLAPVLEQIMKSLALSGTAAGFITSLPLICFAIFSPFAPKLSQTLGLNRALILAMIFIALGIVLRSLGASSTLYIGTVFIGAGIAFGNVLLPALVKALFPAHISVVTSLYIFVMGIGATLASSLMVPLSNVGLGSLSGWQFALMINVVFPVATLIFWLPRAFSRTAGSPRGQSQRAVVKPMAMFKSPVAWYVTLALGINSFTAYSLSGWLPKILTDYGYRELDAGYIYGLMQFAMMIPGLILMPILAKMKRHFALAFLCSGGVFVGLFGLMVLPQFSILWVALFGFTNCATFIIAMSFIGLRTNSTEEATALSSMAQSLGYLLAATGPLIVGYSHSLTDAWFIPLGIIALFSVFCVVFLLLAARDKTVQLK